METSAGFHCDIAPIMPIPPGKRQVFTYLSDTDIPRGSLVSVPFRSFTVRGVVLSSGPVASGTLPSARLKRVKSVIREAFLTGSQIALVEWLSHECLTSLGKTMKHVLPAIVTERKRERKETPKMTLRLSVEERKIREALSGKKPGMACFLESDGMTALRVVASEKRLRGGRSQFLVLVPEIVMLPFVDRFLRETFGDDRVATLESRRSDGAFFSAWEAVRSGKADVIVGTRQAVFAPFRNLSHILVLGEGEVLGYKQWDMSPRYDMRHIAEQLAHSFGARLVFSDTMAGLDMRLRMKEKAVARLPTPKVSKPPEVTLVNMREERFRKNRSIISEAVGSAVSDALKWHRKSILVVSRSGLDSFSVCESCKAVPRCPECDRALRSTREGHFTCPSCRYKTTSFPRCRECGSLSFRNVGSGTEKVEAELGKRFPGGHILRIDEAAIRTDPALHPDRLRETILRADIIVGTPSILNIPHLPNIGPIAIMDTDNFLSMPDFRGDERFLRMISRAFSADLENGRGRLLLQTFRPERDFFDRIREGDLETPIGRVEKDREALRYPPYRALFRIGFRDRSEISSERVTDTVRERLAKLASDMADITVSPVMKPLLPKIRGRYERFFLVSLPAGEPLPDSIRDLLLDVPGSWFFEPDPLSIL